MKKLKFLLLSIILPVLGFSKGLDERINDWFAPIADAWEHLVLYPVPIAGFNIPIVIILLVCGALFFTIYFGFVNIRRFPLAINVVRGKI